MVLTDNTKYRSKNKISLPSNFQVWPRPIHDVTTSPLSAVTPLVQRVERHVVPRIRNSASTHGGSPSSLGRIDVEALAAKASELCLHRWCQRKEEESQCDESQMQQSRFRLKMKTKMFWKCHFSIFIRFFPNSFCIPISLREFLQFFPKVCFGNVYRISVIFWEKTKTKCTTYTNLHVVINLIYFTGNQICLFLYNIKPV
jgi:hypothetical protein